MRTRVLLETGLGVYLATLSVPAVALWVRASGRGLPSAQWVLAAWVATVAVVAVSARFAVDLVDRSASVAGVALTVLPPLAYLPYTIVATTPESTPALLSLVGLLAVLPGLFVPLTASVIRNRRLRADATELVVVTVGDGSDDNRTAVIAGTAVFALATVGFGAAAVFFGEFEIGSLSTVLGGGSSLVLLFAGDDETEVAVTDTGLRIDQSITPWTQVAGYRVTDERIELVRSRRYLPARSLDRADIDDERALLDGLGSILPRLDEDGRVERVAGRD